MHINCSNWLTDIFSEEKESLMKAFIYTIVIVILAMRSYIAQAEIPYRTIDDFNTGPQEEVILKSGSKVHDQAGSMLGSFRHVDYSVSIINASGLDRKGAYTINKGHLIVEDGVHIASRLEISYGIDKNNNVNPLNLDLSRALTTGQFTLHFHSLDMLNQINAMIQIATRSRGIFQISKQIIPPVLGKFNISFPLSSFRSDSQGKPPTKNDFRSIDYITLILQEGGNGGSDYAINLFDITFVQKATRHKT